MFTGDHPWITLQQEHGEIKLLRQLASYDPILKILGQSNTNSNLDFMIIGSVDMQGKEIKAPNEIEH